jgi:hypothetical protein
VVLTKNKKCDQGKLEQINKNVNKTDNNNVKYIIIYTKDKEQNEVEEARQ